jgi:hypothetical protein
MEATHQEKPSNRPNPRWRRILNGLFFGALCGSILAVGIAAFYLGPSCYLDDRPATFGGTQGSWAILLSSIWGAVGATVGALFCAIVSLPNELTWRLITAALIVAVLAVIMLVINTASFF